MNIRKNLLLLAIILTIWQIASLFVNPLFVPSPILVTNAFAQSLKSGLLFESFLHSFGRITVATFLSGSIAILLAVLIQSYNCIQWIVSPMVNVMRFIPVTGFYPLLVMWFGIDESMKIAFLFIATFVYMLPSTILCFQEVNQEKIDTALTMGMNKFQIATKIMLPCTLPSILKTFVMMYGIGWTYIAVCEQVNARSGLGFIIAISSARAKTDMVFMAIIAIMIFSVIFDYISQKTIKKIFKWRFSENAMSE